jgi:hypothetical protein
MIRTSLCTTKFRMRVKSFSPTIAKLSTGSLLAVMLLFFAATIATAQSSSVGNRTFSSEIKESKSDAIDSYTDHFFYATNPELNKRKLRSGDQSYIQEWLELRQAIAPLVKSSYEACVFGKRNGDAYWEFDLSASNGGSSYDYLSDVIYYYRNPNMVGVKLRPDSAAREWSAIRQNMYISTCGI